MSESMRIWVEVVFNVTYLIVIWTLVAMMARRQTTVAPADRPVAKRLMWAFALLALGDTGHVGFRVVAYALGGLEANPALVGLGALSTAYTVTLFYMLMVDIWRLRYNKPLGNRRVDAAGCRRRALDHHGFSGEPLGADRPAVRLEPAPQRVAGGAGGRRDDPDPARRVPNGRHDVQVDRRDDRAFLCLLRAGDPLVGADPDARHADDPQDVRVRRHCDHRLSGAIHGQKAASGPNRLRQSRRPGSQCTPT